MEPEIRYTRTRDGVNLAYWTLGSGFPLVYLPPTMLHVQLDWQHARNVELYNWLARNHLLVRFDERGRGLSQRENVEYSLEAEMLDLEAIVSRLGLEQMDVFAIGGGVSTAVCYAALHPAQVRKLSLVDPFAPFRDVLATGRVRALGAALPLDYDVFTEFFAYMVDGWQSDATTRKYAALLRESASQEQTARWFARMTREYMEAFERSLAGVRAQTLIVYHGDALMVPRSSPERLATEIPDARLIRLEGKAVSMTTDPLMMVAVDDFLLSDGPSEPLRTTGLPSGTAVILFVDIESSTALTERMGDTAFREASRALDEHVRTAVRAAGGTPVEGKVLGDGVMSVFSSAAQAIAGAEACRGLSAASELRLHIGLHAGDVIREDDNVYGGAVNIAARICDACTPGEVLVSSTVRDLARTSAGVAFEDRGERALKGIAEPQRVFAVLGQT